VSQLQTKAAKPMLSDLRHVNAVIREAHDSKDQELQYHPLGTEKLRLLVYADSSYNSRDTTTKHKSQIGFVILLASDEDSDKIDGTVHLLDWSSKKSTRVTKSTLGCETVAQTAAVESAVKLAGWLEEIDGDQRISIRTLRNRQEKGGFMYPVDVFTDAYSVYQCLTVTKQPDPSDASCLMWLQWLRQQWHNKVLRGCGWVSTQDMQADGLTKHLPGQEALRRLMTGKLQHRFSCIMDGRVVEGAKGLPPPKRQAHDCSTHFVESVQRARAVDSSFGGLAWWHLSPSSSSSSSNSSLHYRL
jgi:hypothetical protein